MTKRFRTPGTGGGRIYVHDGADEPQVYTVSELTREIKGLLEESWAEVCVEGEVSNYRHHSSGHRYFSIKDANAELKVVIWRNAGARLRFEPENGMKIRALGSIAVYEKRGVYQLNARALIPVGTGELEIAFRQLYERLSEEGLFEEDRKQDLPEYPFTIGVVTSPTGAAIRDIVNVASRRNPAIKLIIFPAAVQGDGAEDTIAEGLDYFNTRDDIDIIIVGRGGGSLEDLWAFNTEIVVRAIVRSVIPVVAGVGHEVDTTLADLAADYRAPTPSAAAEISAWEAESALENIRTHSENLSSRLERLVVDLRERIESITTRGVFADPEDIIRQREQSLDNSESRFRLSARGGFERMQNELSLAIGRLDSLSPLATLGRGYSVARMIRPDGTTGGVITAAEQTKPGDKIDIFLRRGKLSGSVEKVSKEWNTS
ncbi:MAG: exodeoxyribonuclease VII large subunit [candidate division Zixibacteria bacterium]|nr:exodeoxyribonuclease VII large subunit [candidate division Zixibacteria bacterium]